MTGIVIFFSMQQYNFPRFIYLFCIHTALDFCGKIFTFHLLTRGFSFHRVSFLLPLNWNNFNLLYIVILQVLLVVVVVRLVDRRLLNFAADTAIIRRTRSNLSLFMLDLYLSTQHALCMNYSFSSSCMKIHGTDHVTWAKLQVHSVKTSVLSHLIP